MWVCGVCLYVLELYQSVKLKTAAGCWIESETYLKVTNCHRLFNAFLTSWSWVFHQWRPVMEKNNFYLIMNHCQIWIPFLSQLLYLYVYKSYVWATKHSLLLITFTIANYHLQRGASALSFWGCANYSSHRVFLAPVEGNAFFIPLAIYFLSLPRVWLCRSDRRCIQKKVSL